jgi:hypothetical protein
VKVVHWAALGLMLVAAEQEPPKQFMTLEKKHVPEYDPHSMRNYEAEYDPHSMRDLEAEYDPHSKRDHEAEYDLKSLILSLHRLPHHLQQVQ